MIKALMFFLMFAGVGSTSAIAQQLFEKDVLQTSEGEIEITFIGHGSLLFTYNGKVIYVDPYSKLADYSKLPKADLIFLTHAHRDHLDPEALAKIQTEKTTMVVAEICASQIKGAAVMKNGETVNFDGLKVEAVPAYNLIHKRDNGQPFHQKGEGNGYIIIFGDKRVYIAGDTENIPEMKALRDIDCAFLPMNLPYTMTPEMVADATRIFKPAILYPYHYGETDPAKLVELLETEKDVDIRIRKMQ